VPEKSYFPILRYSRRGISLPVLRNGVVPDLSVAIVGFGPTGHFTLREIANFAATNPNTNIKVNLFDPKGFDGRGIHTRPENKSDKITAASRQLVLNTSADGTFSAYDIRNGYHFPAFAARNGFSPQDFLPRYLLGDFMAMRTDELFTRADNLPNLDIQKHQRRAEKLCDVEKPIERYDHVFCCTGHTRMPSADHLTDFSGFYKNLFYLPEANDIYHRQGNADHTLVIPGGFTSSMDAVRMAENLDYRGKYTLICRSGFLQPEIDNERVRAVPAWQLYDALNRAGRMEVISDRTDMQQVSYHARDKVFEIPLSGGGVITAANLCNAAIWSDSVMPQDHDGQIMTDTLMQSIYMNTGLDMGDNGTWRDFHAVEEGISALGSALNNPGGNPWAMRACSDMCRAEVTNILCGVLNAKEQKPKEMHRHALVVA